MIKHGWSQLPMRIPWDLTLNLITLSICSEFSAHKALTVQSTTLILCYIEMSFIILDVRYLLYCE